MDVVLELFDTFLFDRLYAHFLPAFPQLAAPKYVANATFSSMREAPTGYVFEPASQYLSFQPSDFAYMSRWSRNNIYRQAVSLYLITWLFGMVVYFFFSTLSYLFIFDHESFKHPKFHKNQVRMEIALSLQALPIMAIFTVPCWLAEVRGHTKIYDTSADGPGLWYDVLQFPLFLAFTDFFIYWIHRGLHHPQVYRRLHKSHHKWIVPTPFASHAFHPLDGFLQSLPYHVFPLVFPLQKFAYVALFVFVNIWTVLIHDGEYAHNSSIINGAACHTLHHLKFHYNYGQFTTLWDRLCGSYRQPGEELFRREDKMGRKEWQKQSEELETILAAYDPDELKALEKEGILEKQQQQQDTKKVQ